MNDYELIWDFLHATFNYEYYTAAIENTRQILATNLLFQEEWSRIVEDIRLRNLQPGQPLYLVNHGANQVLDENTDEEAYRWLDLMIRNVERTDGQIEQY
jgi:hypothetical protein